MTRKHKDRLPFPWEKKKAGSSDRGRTTPAGQGPATASTASGEAAERPPTPADARPSPSVPPLGSVVPCDRIDDSDTGEISVADDSPDGQAPGPLPAPPTSGRIQFREENTDEYDVSEMWEKGSARSQVSVAIGETVEDTRELIIQSGRKRAAREGELEQQKWATPPTLRARLRLWLADDPLVIWYLGLPKPTRALLSRFSWILATAVAIAAVFSISALGIYPLVEEHVRPAFAPRPEEPTRLVAREGLAFDLVEDRDYPLEPFRLGTDCIWIARSPLFEWKVDPPHFELVDASGTHVASLDVRLNWDGLIRVYFGVGDLPSLKPLWIRVTLANGGLWPQARTLAYSVSRLGGMPPPFVDVGPVRFVE